MNNLSSNDSLLHASRLTGADVLFERLVQAVSAEAEASPAATDPAMRERIVAVYDEFRRSYAKSFEKRLGRAQALEAAAALERAPIQRFLAARAAMNPSFRRELEQLRHRMGELEI